MNKFKIAFRYCIISLIFTALCPNNYYFLIIMWTAQLEQSSGISKTVIQQLFFLFAYLYVLQVEHQPI